MSSTTATAPALGRELRMCPRRRPNLVYAITSLGLGVLAAVLLVGLLAEGKTRASDLQFVAVLTGIFVVTGVVLLLLRRRTIARRAAIRIFEGGVVREDRTGRRALAYADVSRLQARITATIGGRFYIIALAPRSGPKLAITSLWFDNVDASLIDLLADRTGRAVEPL